jgi:putative transposase
LKKLTRKAYKFRIYPTSGKIAKFEHTLDLCRELYNGALQERRDAYRMAGKSLNYYDQQNQLSEIKEVRPDLCEVHSQVLQDVLKRVDKSFKGFFARCKRGDTPGFPRFQGKGRYNSFTYPQGGWSLHNDKLTLSKIGTFKVKLHREVLGKVKTCTIKREGHKWFVVFSVEYEFDCPDYHDGPPVGIDVGLEYFSSQSDGVQVENPRIFRKAQKHLATPQRRVAKVKHLPRNDAKKLQAKRAVRNAHTKVSNQRRDFLHKQSRLLVNTYSVVVVEELQVKNLLKRSKPKLDPETNTYLPNGAAAKSGLSKSISDAGWSTFINMLSYKAENAGSKLIKVPPAYTSQICPNPDCGVIVKKDLSERWHSCPCGCEMPRDVAAAIVILRRGLASLRNQSVDAPAARSGE